MMRTIMFMGVVDPNTWKNPYPPDGSREGWTNQWDVQKDLVRQCRRFGIKGHTYPDGSPKQPGRNTIARFISDRFPAETPKLFRLGYRLAGVHVIGKWGRGIEFAPDEGVYSPDDVSRQWRIYVARLSMISEFWYGYPLTPKQAEFAQDVGNEFQDPLGKQVDLIPQLAVVRILTGAEQGNHAGDLQRIALYFTCAPWESGRDFYEDKLEGIEHAIVLPDFMLSMDEKRGWRDVSPVYEDALRQLGVPYAGFWYDLDKGGVRDIRTTSHYGVASNGTCDWKLIVKTRDLAEQREFSRPLDTAETRLESLLKIEKWKQIERVYEGKSND
jgi:hypothetical protein